MIESLSTHFGVDAFERPLWLAIGITLAIGATWMAARRPPRALPWPAWTEAGGAGARRFDFFRALGSVARAGALALLSIALAGPVREHRAPPEPGRGLDLVLALDTSDSMQALDAESGGVWHTRLHLAREVVARFAQRRVAEGDRVGLVVFGEEAFTQAPLSSDGALLGAALARVAPGMAGGATAVGDALALAVKRVGAADLDVAQTAPVAGRLVVLLTDGRSNAGSVPPDVAASLARARGVRVHTVGIGTRGEVAMQRGAGPLRFERHDLDTDTLEGIAQATGGRFFAARSSSDLEAVYESIDALERVARRPPPRVHTSAHPEPFLAGAALLVALEVLGARGVARRIP
jgi:Ca-activated chloride channel family protein